MAVGLFGYLGYDMVRLIEKLPEVPPDPLGLPDAILLRPTITAIFDTVSDEIIVVTPVWPEAGVDARAAYARACERLKRCRGRSRTPRAGSARLAGNIAHRDAKIESNMTHGEYLAIVERAKEYIRAGDVFQVVPSQRFRRAFALPPLRRSIARCAGSTPRRFSITSPFPVSPSSDRVPEILVRLRDGVVTIRPIAGTRPRGKTPEEDKALARRTDGRSQGARRTSDAGRSGPQRCRAAWPKPAR